MDIELVAQPSLIHYHKWVVQQVKVCIKDYTYKTLTSFGCLQFIITLWLPFCNINNDQKEEAGSGIQSRFVQCVVWSSSFILTATRHLLSLMLHAVKEKQTHLRACVMWYCSWLVSLVKNLIVVPVYWWQIYFKHWCSSPPNGVSHSSVTWELCKVYFTCVLDKTPCEGWHLL